MNLPIKEIMEFLTKLVDRSGAKSIVTLAAITALYYLGAMDKLVGIYAGAGIFGVVFTFSIFRYLEYRQKKNGGQT